MDCLNRSAAPPTRACKLLTRRPVPNFLQVLRVLELSRRPERKRCQRADHEDLEVFDPDHTRWQQGVCLIDPPLVDKEHDEAYHADSEGRNKLRVVPAHDRTLGEASVEQRKCNNHDEHATQVEAFPQRARDSVAVVRRTDLGKQQEGEDRARDTDDRDEAEEPAPAGDVSVLSSRKLLATHFANCDRQRCMSLSPLTHHEDTGKNETENVPERTADTEKRELGLLLCRLRVHVHDQVDRRRDRGSAKHTSESTEDEEGILGSPGKRSPQRDRPEHEESATEYDSGWEQIRKLDKVSHDQPKAATHPTGEEEERAEGCG